MLALVWWTGHRWAAGERGVIQRLRRPKVVRDVTRGIERGEFELHFQPQVEIESGQPFAAEALLRWRRNGELRTPNEFLPDVEASEAIGPLTDHVVAMALEQAGRWHAAGRPIKVSVNLSPANLRDASLPGRVGEMLDRHGVMPGMLTLEVTETAVLEEPEQARAVLDAIAGLGVSISIDDFGTGYSSLLWLRLFPVSEVKIDRTFVSDLKTDGEAYVLGVIRLAHDLGLSVVAEGIEDESTLQQLQQLGCDVGQGYLFSRPEPPSALEPWFDEHRDEQMGATSPGAPPPRRLQLPGCCPRAGSGGGHRARPRSRRDLGHACRRVRSHGQRHRARHAQGGRPGAPEADPRGGRSPAGDIRRWRHAERRHRQPGRSPREGVRDHDRVDGRRGDAARGRRHRGSPREEADAYAGITYAPASARTSA